MDSCIVFVSKILLKKNKIRYEANIVFYYIVKTKNQKLFSCQLFLYKWTFAYENDKDCNKLNIYIYNRKEVFIL